MRFATIQLKMAIIEIVKNFEITTNAKTNSAYVMNSKSFIPPSLGELWFSLRKIKCISQE